MNKKILLFLIVGILAVSGCAVAEPEPTAAAPEETTASETQASTQDDGEKIESGFSVNHIGDSDFDSIIPNTEGVVVVDFWAEWCGPCVALGPVLEGICEEENIALYKVDVDENQALAQSFSINAIPAVHIYKDGKLVDDFVGFIGEDEIKALISKYK